MADPIALTVVTGAYNREREAVLDERGQVWLLRLVPVKVTWKAIIE